MDITNFFDTIDDAFEKQTAIDESFINNLCAMVNTTDDLGECLPEITKRVEKCKENKTTCDSRIEPFSISKKMWKGREDAYNEILLKLMLKLNTKSIAAGGNKATLSSRNILEVDEKGIIGMYSIVLAQLKAQLPSYIKVDLSVDKTALSSHLNTDNSLMLKHPELVHTKTSHSLRLK